MEPLINFSFADADDTDRLNSSAIEMIEKVVRHFAFLNEVTIHSTIHGFIATFQRHKDRFIPADAGKPGRMDKSDAEFFFKLDGLRWFEGTTDKLKIGFDNHFTS